MEADLSPHTILIEDDLIWLTVRGEFTIAHLDSLNELIEKMLRAQGYLLTLIDVHEARMLSKAVRKKAAENTRDVLRASKTYAASAAYGAGSLVTGLTSLFFSAVRILTQGDHKNTIARTEAEARAFLSGQRRHFRKELGLDPPEPR